jgi:hypothetical protein
MYSKKYLIIVAIVFVCNNLIAQHTYITFNPAMNHIIDRFEIKNSVLNNEYFHTSTKSYRRQSIADYANKLYNNNSNWSNQDLFNLEYLLTDNFEWSKYNLSLSKKPFLKDLYKQKAALLSAQVTDFNLVVNPVMLYQVSTIDFNGNNVLLNNRGIEVRGNITNKIGFYTQVSDEIMRPLPVVYQEAQRTNVYQGVGFYKNPDGKEVNYFLSSGYVSVSANKYMDFQLGHGRQFIGDGVRSFIISNNAVDNFYVRLNTRIWKLNYTNILSEYRDFNNSSYGVQATHYSATHHLSANVGKKLNIGIFETIIFQRDSGHISTGFEINYLNPIIFYKSIEK